jgi:hypothetical protein
MLGLISVTIYGENCSNLSFFGNGFVKKIGYIPFSFDMSDEKLRACMRFDRLDRVWCQSLSHGVVHQDRCDLRVLRNWAPFCAFWKAAPNSAFAADVTTHDMILLVQKIGPFINSGMTRKWRPPSTERALRPHPATAHVVVRHEQDAELVLYISASFGSSTYATL